MKRILLGLVFSLHFLSIQGQESQFSSLGTLSSLHQLALDSSGNLYATDPRAGKIFIWALTDSGYSKPTEWIRELQKPTGMAIGTSGVWVVEQHQITEITDSGKKRITAIPTNQYISRYYLSLDSTENLVIGFGVNCVHCIADPPFGSLQSINTHTGERYSLAQGFRAPAGVALDPVTKRLWVTDEAQPTESHPSPGDEINVLDKEKMHFGYPFCHAGTFPDALLGNKKSCELFFGPRIALEKPSKISGICFDKSNAHSGLWVTTRGRRADDTGQVFWVALDKMRNAAPPVDITPKNRPNNFSPSDVIQTPMGIVVADMKNATLWLLVEPKN